MGDKVDFVWKNEAKFKHLLSEDDVKQSALASFAVAIGQIVLQATPSILAPAAKMGALDLRRLLLRNRQFVDLQGLLGVCWSIGIPVVHLRVFPLQAKGMHAMAIRSNDRHAIFLARDADYPAAIAFDLAHELGHVVRGHLSNAMALIDSDEVETVSREPDSDEVEADRYALMLLTGQAVPDIRANITRFNARQLSRAAMASGQARRVEPGTLALCAAHRTAAWPTAFAALRHIYSEAKPVWREVNAIAATQLDWDAIGEDASEYLSQVMGIQRA